MMDSFDFFLSWVNVCALIHNNNNFISISAELVKALDKYNNSKNTVVLIILIQNGIIRRIRDSSKISPEIFGHIIFSINI